VVTEGYQAIEEKLDYLLNFCEYVKQLRGKGISAREIPRRLLGQKDLTSLVALGHFAGGNMVRGCLAGGEHE